MELHYGRVTSKGQITIPAAIRKRLELETGSSVLFLVRTDGLVEVSHPAKDIEAAFGTFSATGNDWDGACGDGSRCGEQGGRGAGGGDARSMIFLDTNVCVEAFGRRDVERVASQELAARVLLSAVARGQVAATTSGAILAETAQVLTCDRPYALPVDAVAAHLSNILRAQGLRFEPKRIYLRALDIWGARPGIGFVDALTVAYVGQGDVQLASFDRQQLGSLGVTPYWQAADSPS